MRGSQLIIFESTVSIFILNFPSLIHLKLTCFLSLSDILSNKIIMEKKKAQ